MNTQFARQIYDFMEDSIHVEEFMDVNRKCVEYAHIRALWTLSDEDAQTRMESERKNAHDSLIKALALLVERMEQSEEPVRWYAELHNNRQEIAELACWVHYHISLEA